MIYTVAPPLQNMANTLKTPHMAGAGDNYDGQDFLKPVTVGDTMKNPAQLSDYLKDYDRLKQYICDNQPTHELCKGDVNIETKIEESMPTMAPSIPPPEPLPFWAWQNIVVYASCVIVALGFIYAHGCCEKSLEQKIIDAQMRAMQPLVPENANNQPQ